MKFSVWDYFKTKTDEEVLSYLLDVTLRVASIIIENIEKLNLIDLTQG